MIFAYSSVNSAYSSTKKGCLSGFDGLFAGASKMLITQGVVFLHTCIYVSKRLILVKFSVDSDFFITIGRIIQDFFLPL